MSKESLMLAHLAGIARRVNVRVREYKRKHRTPWLDARDELLEITGQGYMTLGWSEPPRLAMRPQRRTRKDDR